MILWMITEDRLSPALGSVILSILRLDPMIAASTELCFWNVSRQNWIEDIACLPVWVWRCTPAACRPWSETNQNLSEDVESRSKPDVELPSHASIRATLFFQSSFRHVRLQFVAWTLCLSSTLRDLFSKLTGWYPRRSQVLPRSLEAGHKISTITGSARDMNVLASNIRGYGTGGPALCSPDSNKED